MVRKNSSSRRSFTHVNHPLESSQCSDHDNSDGETIPETTKSNVLIDPSHGSSESLTRRAVGVEFGDLFHVSIMLLPQFFPSDLPSHQQDETQ
jgi:hypothetical protein